MSVVPIDEGEAEAQPDLPVISITLVPDESRLPEISSTHSTRVTPSWQDPYGFPMTFTFDAPAAPNGLRRRGKDELLAAHVAAFVEREGLDVRGEPDYSWADGEESRVRRATIVAVGHVPTTPEERA